MEKTWQINGVYGNWSMTLRLEDDAETDRTGALPAEKRWPGSSFERMGQEFLDMVNLREHVLAAEEPVLYSFGH